MKEEIQAILDNASLQLDKLGDKFMKTTIIPFCDKYGLSYKLEQFKHPTTPNWFDYSDYSDNIWGRNPHPEQPRAYSKHLTEFIDSLENKEEFFSELDKIYEILLIVVGKDDVRFCYHLENCIK
jgi:hypothetical protein